MRVEYFRIRGILPRLRLGIGLCALAATLIPLAALGSAPGDRALMWRVVTACCAASAVLWALRWWVGPMLSGRLSLLFVLSADIALILASTAEVDPRTRLFWFCSV